MRFWQLLDFAIAILGHSCQQMLKCTPNCVKPLVSQSVNSLFDRFGANYTFGEIKETEMMYKSAKAFLALTSILHFLEMSEERIKNITAQTGTHNLTQKGFI